MFNVAQPTLNRLPGALQCTDQDTVELVSPQPSWDTPESGDWGVKMTEQQLLVEDSSRLEAPPPARALAEIAPGEPPSSQKQVQVVVPKETSVDKLTDDYPPPNEAQVTRLRRLGMSRSAVESWFAMCEHPHTAMVFFFSTAFATAILVGYINVINGHTGNRASIFMFVIPGAISATDNLLCMVIVWILGPACKMAVAFRTLHAIGVLVVVHLLIAVSVAPEGWVPFQNRVLAIALGTPFFVVAVFSTYFNDALQPNLRVSGSLRGMMTPLVHSLVSTFKVVNLQTDLALMATLLRLVRPPGCNVPASLLFSVLLAYGCTSSWGLLGQKMCRVDPDRVSGSLGRSLQTHARTFG